jgi:antitoxin ParD1/3/4
MLTVTISPELAKYVEEKVSTGQFATPSEVIDDALRLLKTQETWSAADVEELRREVAIGIEQLDRRDSGPWSADEIKSDGRRMLASRRAE